MHYNYFRDYDPAVGRYVQSDPIGLRGGINTFGYVGAAPLTNADRTGQAAAGWIALGAYLIYEGYSLYQDYEDGREDGRWDCENIVKLSRRIRELPSDDLKALELEADRDANLAKAMSRNVLGPISRVPGTAGSAAKDSWDQFKRFRLPGRGPIIGTLLGEAMKRWGRKRGMAECGCGE